MESISPNEIHHSISVNFNHHIFFSDDILNLSNLTIFNLLKSEKSENKTKTIVFLDRGLDQVRPNLFNQIQYYFNFQSDDLNLCCLPIILEGGETSKNSPKIFNRILQHLEREKICRHSYVVVIGGGSLIDTVCFAASIVHRGIRQIRIPTTTLAQCDAAIGIKNGINFNNKKNFLGSFHPPYAVINDSLFLETLDHENWRNGIAEAVKVALIKDYSFFEWIELMAPKLYSRDLTTLKTLIRRCCELHLNHISNCGDPMEQGSARPLDFGHWSAHKLEQLSNFKLGHGSAVAIGIALDIAYCQKAGFLPNTTKTRILDCLETLGFDLSHNCLFIEKLSGEYAVLDGIEEFREHLGGNLSVTLITEVGEPFQTKILDRELITHCINEWRDKVTCPSVKSNNYCGVTTTE